MHELGKTYISVRFKCQSSPHTESVQSLPEKPERQDVVRNRAALLSAARSVFEERGIEAPLQLVAEAAGLSRASLARHFPTRASLVAALWEADVEEIEALAVEASAEPDGFVRLFDSILGTQVDRRAIRPTAAQIAGGVLDELAQRVAESVGAVLIVSQRAGCVRAEITTDTALLAIDMCATAITQGAERAHRVATWRQVRALILPGLLTGPQRTTPPAIRASSS